MRKTIVGLAGVIALAGCSQSKSSYAGNAGSVALSRDGALVYAVDSDNGAIEVARASDGQKVREVKVGHQPARIVVGTDDRIYVTNRGERTVSVLEKDTFKELARIPVGVEPTGLAFGADGALYVASATDLNDTAHGTLTAIDTKSLAARWSIPVGEEARGVAVVGKKAYVTSLKKGTVAVVDLEQHQVVSGIDLSSPDSADPSVNPNAMSPGGVVDVTASPDGERVYAPHVWQLVGNIEGDRSVVVSGGGSYGGPQTCNGSGSIVTAGLATIVTSSDEPKTDSNSAQANCGDGTTTGSSTTGGNDFPASMIPTRAGQGEIVQGPSAAAVDPSGAWIFVANRNSNNVVVMPTKRRQLSGGRDRFVVNVGAAPDGIAISSDGKSAYVYSQFDHSLSILRQGSDGSDSITEAARVKLASDTLPADQVEGRRMFFSAVDPRMTAQNIGIACASCHMEGREDGHVWQFPDGPRQTPLLAGRHLELTAPYHWAGLFATVNQFYRETVIGRMGGMGLRSEEADHLTSFIEGMPAPENPFQGRPDLLEAQQRGKAAFAKANCASCHTGEAMTDNGLHNVGTLSTADRLEILSDGIEDRTQLFPQLQAVNTPSLIGLARTAPYLHDGSVSTLRGRLDQARFPRHDGLDHGDTSMLDDQELADLEQYLKSL